MVRFGPSRKGTQRGCRFHHEPVQAPVFFAHRRWAQRADPPSRVQPVGGGQLPDRSTDQHLRTQDPEQSVRRQGLRQFVHTSRTGTCPTDRSASRASFASTPVRREYGDIYQQRIYRSRSQMRWGVQHFHDQVQIARGRLAHDQRRLQRPARHGNALCLQTLQSKDHDHSTNGSGSYLFDNEIDQRYRDLRHRYTKDAGLRDAALLPPLVSLFRPSKTIIGLLFSFVFL